MVRLSLVLVAVMLLVLVRVAMVLMAVVLLVRNVLVLLVVVLWVSRYSKSKCHRFNTLSTEILVKDAEKQELII